MKVKSQNGKGAGRDRESPSNDVGRKESPIREVCHRSREIPALEDPEVCRNPHFQFTFLSLFSLMSLLPKQLLSSQSTRKYCFHYGAAVVIVSSANIY